MSSGEEEDDMSARTRCMADCCYRQGEHELSMIRKIWSEFKKEEKGELELLVKRLIPLTCNYLVPT